MDQKALNVTIKLTEYLIEIAIEFYILSVKMMY